MRLFVFRSLPLSADSRIGRNAHILDGVSTATCTWERTLGCSNSFNYIFPFSKSGGKLVRGLKYILFLLWVPYIVMFRVQRGDVVIFMDLETILFGGLVAKLKDIFIVFDIVDPFAQTKHSLRNFAGPINRIECLWANLADLVLVPHESRIKYYLDIINKPIKAKKVVVVENVPQYPKSIFFQKKQRHEERCVIGYFGTLDFKTRGLERLISLAQLHPDSFFLIIAGQGGMEQAFQLMSKQHDNIRFVGAFTKEDLPLLYAEVDFTWGYYSQDVTLHKYAAPNKFYEHLYFRTPIITSSVIPQSEIIENLGSGVLVDLKIDSDSDVKNKIMNYKSSNLFSIQKKVENHWSKHYDNYYTKISKLFKEALISEK